MKSCYKGTSEQVPLASMYWFISGENRLACSHPPGPQPSTGLLNFTQALDPSCLVRLTESKQSWPPANTAPLPWIWGGSGADLLALLCSERLSKAGAPHACVHTAAGREGSVSPALREAITITSLSTTYTENNFHPSCRTRSIFSREAASPS